MGESNNKFLGFRLIELLSRLLVLSGFTMLGAFIGQFIGLLSAFMILDISVKPGSNTLQLQQMLMDFMQNPTNFNHGQRAFMAMQWFTSLGTFVGAAWAFNKYIFKQELSDLSPNSSISWHIFLWAIITMVVGTPLLEYIIELNKNMVLPTAYKDLETWMRSSELAMEKTTKLLLHFDSHLDFILGIMTIGFMAALGEELFFRGVVQNLFLNYLNNTHVAIWLSAAIFSFIHFQFFGFFPRLLLGAFFGYLYVWYKNIWVPVLAHFFNNALGVTASYLYQLKLIEYDPIEGSMNNELYVVIISLVLVIFYMRRLYRLKL
ncbi:MAG: hypothetical protein RJA76_104 [Bacteroidota bacterium]|jgi:membrane protease YdiL (CAAX protease family)